MRRFVPMWLALAAFATSPAFGDPGISVEYRHEVLRVTLDGSYGGSYYRVLRAEEIAGPYDAMESQFSLCTGDCFLSDQETVPGRTYYYRFELQPPSGGLVSYGPYAVTVPETALGARIWPNPSYGGARIELSVPGTNRLEAPVRAEVKLLDLQGRTLRLLYAGELVRGVTSMAWDGRGDAGQQIGAGIHFLRLSTTLGTSTTRIARLR